MNGINMMLLTENKNKKMKTKRFQMGDKIKFANGAT
jgi:hypothetical protein